MRGQGSFSPETLTSQLKDFTLDSDREPAELADYRSFYHLDLALEFPDLQHHIGWVASGQFKIATQLFALPDARASAVICHGYYDHVGLFGHLIRFLLEHRMSVLTFDLPGHGLSSGPRATIETFDQYVETLVDVLAHVKAQIQQRDAAALLPEPWHLFGQSMGGAISMEYLLRYGRERYREVVLLAPLIRPYAWGVNRWVYEVARRTITERKRIITENAENPEFMALMRNDPLAPDTLPVQWVTAMVAWMRAFERRGQVPAGLRIVQGDTDRTVDWRYNLKFLQRHSDTDVLQIAGGRHHLVNESDAIRRRMFSWISDYLKTSNPEV
jgi:alpha-beta hydrolase superfamily lysophospholipase